MLVRPADVEEIHEPSNALVMKALVDAARGSGDLSLTWVRIAGRHRRLRTDRSTRLYYLLEGQGSFTIGDEPAFEIRAGDVVVVPRGAPYELSGELAYLVVNAPAFVAGDDVYYD